MAGTAALGGQPQGGGADRRPAIAGLYALYLVAFTVQLGMQVTSPILPDIMREFALSASQTGLIVTAFGLARLVIDLPLGLLLDRVNRTALLILGTLLIMGGSAASGLAADYTSLLVARFAMGTGSALCTVTALFSLSRAAGTESRGRVIGTYQACVLAGTTFSPAIGGAVATLVDWRYSFFFCAFTGLLAMLVVAVASGLGKLKFSASPAQKGHPGEKPLEKAGPRRLPWDLVAINFTTFIFFLSMSGFRNAAVPLYGGTELGLGAGTLGLVLGGSAIVRFLVTLGSGFASDRYGRKVILIPGTLFLAAGTLGFVLARDLTGFALCMVVLSLGGTGNSLPTTMVVDAVPPGRVGMAISVNRFVGDAGMLVGPVALGWVLDLAGFPNVRIIVSGGLTPDRIRYFIEAGAPVNSFGVGSYVSGARPIDFTGDLKEIENRPVAKRGRLPGITPTVGLKRIDLYNEENE